MRSTRNRWRNRLSCFGVFVGVLICRELALDIKPAIDPTVWVVVTLLVLLPALCVAHGWVGWFLGSEVDRMTGTSSASPIFASAGRWTSCLTLLGLAAGLSVHFAFETAWKYALPFTTRYSTESLVPLFCLWHGIVGWRIGRRLDRVADSHDDE